MWREAVCQCTVEHNVAFLINVIQHVVSDYQVEEIEWKLVQ